MAGIFISYRREDASGHAGRIGDRLRQRFGENARKRADEEWDFRVQAREMKNFYEALLRKNRRI